MSTEDQQESNMISFQTRQKISPDEVDAAEQVTKQLLEEGFAFLQEEVKKATTTGFVALVFDQSGKPRVVSAGDLEFFTTIGALEVVKNEFVKELVPTFD